MNREELLSDFGLAVLVAKVETASSERNISRLLISAQVLRTILTFKLTTNFVEIGLFVHES